MHGCDYMDISLIIQVREQHKQADKSKKEEDDAEKRAKNLEEAKLITIEEDKSLPAAERIKIVNGRLIILIVIL